MFRFISILLCCFFVFPSVGQEYENPTVRIESQQLVKTIQLDGKIMPYTIHELKSPLDSQLLEMNFHFGDTVKANDFLLRFQADQLKEEIRASKLSLISLMEELVNLRQWQQGVEAAKIRENIEKAKEHYLTVKAHYKKSKVLFNKGILSLDEIENEQKLFKDAKRSLRAQKKSFEDILQVKEKATHLAKLKHATEEKKLKYLQLKQSKLVLYSPFDGVILPPFTEQNSQADSGQVLIGKSYQANEVIAVVAKKNPFLLIVKADDMDAVGLTKQDLAEVQFHLFASQRYKGEIIEVKPLLAGLADRHQSPSFVISVLVDEAEIPFQWTFGMGAKVTIQKSMTAQGWVIPKTALFYEESYPYCWVRMKPQLK